MNSICVATYNGEQYIEQQLRSILEQIAPEDEVIVSDDGSTDGTLARIQALKDKRIRVVSHPHVGATQSFYIALDQAKGDYIFLSDQDDVWLEQKVARSIEVLQTYDMVVTDACVTDASLKPVAPSLFGLLGSREGLWKNWIACTFYGATMAFRRAVLEAAKPFPKARYIAHDWWLGMVAEMTGKVCFLPEQHILYRRHEDTVTQLNGGSLLTRSARPMHVKIAARLQMAYGIIRYQCRRLVRK